ncbi:MAG: hypothetical protein ACAH95_08320 [Fimbriimonas sp.]
MAREIDIVPAFTILLRECFEGRPQGQDFTWFVEGKEGIFDALSSTTAEQASAKPSPECSSIAAHATHVLFALQFGNSFIGGPKVEGDWESSWHKQAATSEEWQQLAIAIRREYEFFLNWFETSFPDREVEPAMFAGVLGTLPHMAYHLGAIRQLMKL